MSWIDDNQSEINEAEGQYPEGESMTPQEMLQDIKEADEIEDGIAWYKVQWLIARVEQLEEVTKDAIYFCHVLDDAVEDDKRDYLNIFQTALNTGPE